MGDGGTERIDAAIDRLDAALHAAGSRRFELDVAVKRPISARPEPGAVVATAVRPLD
jgi:hypothetical protein